MGAHRPIDGEAGRKPEPWVINEWSPFVAQVYSMAPGAWAGIVSMWAHMPAELRRSVHTQVVQGLTPGGVFILEAYTPAQLAFDTGGPRSADLLMSAAQLCDELAGLEFQILRKLEREVREGAKHTGRAAVVQVLADGI